MTKTEVINDLNPAEVAIQRVKLFKAIDELSNIAAESPELAQRLAGITASLFGCYRTFNIVLEAVECED